LSDVHTVTLTRFTCQLRHRQPVISLGDVKLDQRLGQIDIRTLQPVSTPESVADPQPCAKSSKRFNLPSAAAISRVASSRRRARGSGVFSLSLYPAAIAKPLDAAWSGA
jgi:hypothetical protein